MALRRLAGHTVIYGFSVIFGRLLNYFLVPLYTSYLDPQRYGNFTEFYAWVPFAFIIYTYGMETTYFRYAGKKDFSEPEVFNTVITMLVASSLGLTLIFLPGLLSFGDQLGFNIPPLYIYVFCGILLVDAISVAFLARLRHQGRSVKFSVIRLVTILITIGLNIFFVVILPDLPSRGIWKVMQGWNLQEGAIFVSNLAANLIQLVILLPVAGKFRLGWNGRLAKTMLVYAVPILIMGIPGTINMNFSRMMLDNLLPADYYPGYNGKDIQGIYGACYSLSVFMLLIVQAYRYAAEPIFFNSADNKDFEKLLIQSMKGFIIVGGLVLVMVSLNLHLAPIVIRRADYLLALDVVPILLLANLFMGIYYNLSIWFKITDRTRFALLFTLSGACVTIALNYLLIPQWGFMGSAFATLCSFFIMMLLCYFFGQKYYPVGYDIGSALLYVFLPISLIYFLDLGEFYNFDPILVGIAGPLIYVGFAAIMERNLIRNLINVLRGNKSNK